MKMKILNGYGKYNELLKNTIIFGFGFIGTKFVQFILLPYFTNVLTKSEYGTIDLVINFVGLIVPIITLELSDSVLRFGLSDKVNKINLTKNVGMILIISSIATVVLSPLLDFYKSISDYKWYIVLLIVSQAIRINCALFVKSNNKIAVYSMDSILTSTIIAILDVILISQFHMSVRGYFIAEIIGNISSIIFLVIIGEITKYISLYGIVDWKLMKEMLAYSIPLMFNALSWWIVSFSDRMVIDLFFSTEEVGIYSVAAKIPAIVTTLISVFTQAWIISAVKEYENEKEVKYFENVYILYTAFLFTLVSFSILIIKPLMRVYVGKDFFDAWYYVPLLLMGTVFLGISNYYGAIYASAKANILEIKSTLICAGSNIVLNFILIPQFSITGAVIATTLSYAILVVVRLIDTKTIIIINNSFSQMALMSAFLFVEIYFSMENNWNLAILSGAGLIVLNILIMRRYGYIDTIRNLLK